MRVIDIGFLQAALATVWWTVGPVSKGSDAIPITACHVRLPPFAPTYGPPRKIACASKCWSRALVGVALDPISVSQTLAVSHVSGPVPSAPRMPTA